MKKSYPRENQDGISTLFTYQKILKKDFKEKCKNRDWVCQVVFMINPSIYNQL